MLMMYRNFLFPSDTSEAVADFVAREVNSDNRWFIIYNLPTRVEDSILVDEAYFCNTAWWTVSNVIMTKGRDKDRARDIAAYALDHIVAIYPNTQKRQKAKERGIVRADYASWINKITYNVAKEGLIRWLHNNPETIFFDFGVNTVRQRVETNHPRGQEDGTTD